MEIFKELTKKGYKHYYEGTIEELDLMDKNNPNLHSEIMQVIMWLYEKHGIWISVFEMERSEDWSNYFDYSIKQKKIGLVDISKKLEEFNNPTEAYEEAVDYVIKNLI